mgnify:CR=1 FL=1
MKKIIILLFVLNFTIFYSQSIENLKTETNNFYAAHYNMDFEGIASLYHPNYFEKFTKETITAGLDERFQNDVDGIRFVFPTMTFNYAPIREINNVKYCVITFKNSFRIIMSNTQAESQVQKDLASYLKIKNYKSVKFESKRNSYFIEENVTWIAVSSAQTNWKWTFIEMNSTFKSLDELLDTSLQKELGL